MRRPVSRSISSLLLGCAEGPISADRSHESANAEESGGAKQFTSGQQHFLRIGCGKVVVAGGTEALAHVHTFASDDES